MFMAALLTTTKIWKQSKCPTTDKLIKKLWCVHTHTHAHHGILLSHKKMKFCHLQEHGWTWRVLCFSEISQTEKDKHCMISFTYEI